MRKGLARIFRAPIGSQGQLAAVMPMAMAIGIGGILMWAYNRGVQSGTVVSRDKAEVERLGNVAMRKLEKVLRTPDTTTASCTQLSGLLAPYRDIGHDPASDWAPASIPLGSTPVPPTWLSCLFSTGPSNTILDDYQEIIGAGTPLASIDIHVGAVGATDWESLARNVDISIFLVGYDPSGSQRAVTINLKQTVRLQAASLSRYGIVLRDWTPPIGSYQITAPASATVIMSGTVFRAGTGSPALDQVIDPGSSSVIFNRQFDLQASAFQYNNEIALRSLQGIFKGGIKTGVFNYGSAILLPIDDGVVLDDPTATPAPSVWDMKLNYYAPAMPNPIAYQLRADVNGNSNPTQLPVGLQTYLGGPGGASVSFASTDALVTTTPASAPVAAPAGPPNEYGNGSGTQQSQPLGSHDSCQNRNAFWVFSDGSNDATVLNTDWDTGSTQNELCALIYARNVIFNLTAGNTYRFYGQIIAQQIQVNVTGSNGATLIFANPLDNIDISGHANQSQILMWEQGLASSVAHNFFVPILARDASYWTNGSTAAAFRANYKLILPYRPHGSVVPPGTVPATQGTWTPPAGASFVPPNAWPYTTLPATAQQRVGFMFLCVNTGSLPYYFCPLTRTDPPLTSEKQDSLRTDLTLMTPPFPAPTAGPPGDLANALVFQ